MIKLQMKPKQVVKKLLGILSPRGKDVIIKRFGLDTGNRMTLEAIGQKYSITRERVRQIEDHALTTMKKSSAYVSEKASFDELENHVKEAGGIVAEEDFLMSISNDKTVQNHIHLMMTIGDPFRKEKEDDEFKHRWYVDPELSEKVHEALRKLYKSLSDEDLVPESELVASFLEHLKDVSFKYKDEEMAKRWLSISKNISKNPFGEWGKATSSNIRLRGIRDYAFLALRKHGSPIHFKDVANSIEKLFDRKAHVATTHNELIKDKRFILVGRGLYALAEWGYVAGVVRDVIRYVLDKFGPMTKDEIIDKVLKERYVKENTILVNLQDQRHFKKDKEGRYSMNKVVNS